MERSNQEFQYYRNNRKNSYVRDGILYIKPTLVADEKGEDFLYSGTLQDSRCNKDPCASKAGADIVLPIYSARMISNKAFKYGRLEIKARMPRGDWLWPAIWLLPKHNVYGDWPRSGEIDMVETHGNQNYTDKNGVLESTNRFSSTLHFGPDGSHDRYWFARWEKVISKGPDVGKGFHVYGLKWTDHNIQFTLDGNLIGKIDAPEGGFWHLGEYDKDPGGTDIWKDGNSMAPFDNDFVILMNVAVGGTYFPDDYINHPHPRPWDWSSSHPIRDFWEKRNWWQPTWHGEDAAMQVDYVRLYHKHFPMWLITINIFNLADVADMGTLNRYGGKTAAAAMIPDDDDDEIDLNSAA
ncbi:hypothetical protein L9F63_011098 [Diploptera punctata]|uniref:GH16 domain-containing protein n=1 Tax=Diploptera punctata TaxID=6984 RepID=A0AAD8AGA2_DIPPU|nr:hypothetical protein L9F63_011098 [Diploptera punctata]